MVSFQAKMCRERPRKRQKRKLSLRSVPTRLAIENSKKIAKKIKKLKKHHYGFFSSQNGSGEAENERKKNYRSDWCLTDQE